MVTKSNLNKQFVNTETKNLGECAKQWRVYPIVLSFKDCVVDPDRDPHQVEGRIWIRIKVISWIRIRINVIILIRIRIKVIILIRIRIKCIEYEPYI
jgi:hypothetical protein